MTSGIPLSKEDRTYIIENKDEFLSVLAKHCDCSRDAVRNVLKCEKNKES